MHITTNCKVLYMATLQLTWSDFVVFTNKDLHVERIYFNHDLYVGKYNVARTNKFLFRLCWTKT